MMLEIHLHLYLNVDNSELSSGDYTLVIELFAVKIAGQNLTLYNIEAWIESYAAGVAGRVNKVPHEIFNKFFTFHNTNIIASAPLDMGSNAIINLKDPPGQFGAVNKKYVDSKTLF